MIVPRTPVPQDTLGISILVRNRGSLRGLFGRVEVAGWLRVSSLWPPRGVRVDVPSDLQMQRMPLSGCHGGHGAPWHATVPSGLVFGRLPGRHPHPGYLSCATTAPTWSQTLRNSLGAAAEAATSPWSALSGIASMAKWRSMRPMWAVWSSGAKPGVCATVPTGEQRRHAVPARASGILESQDLVDGNSSRGGCPASATLS